MSLREVDREGIEINWNNKQKDYYHNVWLRHNCQCPLCVADSSGQKTVETVELVNSRVTVLYRMRILYHMRMVHAICVYAYGITVRV